MKEKLTLSIERDLLLKAKRLSKKKGKSISQMFEEWMKSSFSREAPSDQSDFIESFKALWPNIKDGDEIDIQKIKATRIKKRYDI